MTFSATCPEPMHRLFAIVGRDRIDRELRDGWPNLLSAVAYLILEEHGPDQWRHGVELMLEEGVALPAALEDPEQFWVQILGTATGLDPQTGERISPPIRDRPAPRHQRRRSPRYRPGA